MSICVAVNHQTRYRFDRPVTLFPHVVRLRPAPHCRAPIHAYSLNVQPESHFINWQQDPFGNYLARLVFPEKCRELTIEVDVVTEMTVINPFDFFVENYATHYPFVYEPQLAKELVAYLEVREFGPRLTEWLHSVDRSDQEINTFLVKLNQRLNKDIGYIVRMEPGIQSCEETLTKGTGSCRDSAWVLVQVLRKLGLAARFVSGYIIQLAPDVKPLEGPHGPARDFTDLHAWAEVYVPGAGWIGLDPTSGLFAGEGHIPLACTPDAVSAAPVVGLTETCRADFQFRMKLERIREDPRVTKPFSEPQWQAIESLGHTIDRHLEQHDVRLTMGGEPTFVSIDDVDAPEWNIAALGPAKRRQAGELLLRLRRRFAPGGLLHFGQGKWYPGEPLPRWALSCFWRQDGQPVWHDDSLLADELHDYGHTVETAKTFLDNLTARLGIAAGTSQPAYEDVYYYLWKEQSLPNNIDPLTAKLGDGLERRRLMRLLERGLDKITGYVLPLRHNVRQDSPAWESGHWDFKRGRMFLLPGDSSMGYRLPLESLPFVKQEDLPPQPERCPTEPRLPLDEAYRRIPTAWPEDPTGEAAHDRIQEQLLDVPDAAAETTTPRGLVRTALCIEPRGGRLYIFLPPVSNLEHFLELISTIEATAAELQTPVVIEGYTPPRDWRLVNLGVTPDPGVIEVNMQPAQCWDDLKHNTLVLYEEARLCRLTTEKFMLDGRHTGTGGGNHVTLGGRTPADSPLLRRPDVLRSLLTFWQHHPSLSYMFSGLFVGPTSQMPRVDEARHEGLYELETAFQQMPAGQATFPWIVDRLLRNLLVDITGNTHRTEFCIDKLYSPDSLSGRLGIVELRSLEMPPHARMSLVQMLLLRGLLSSFWQKPYEQPLVRWGTELHDRFMLPHYVWEDFKDVIESLQDVGYPFEPEWFAPSWEFRFPRCGAIQANGLQLELRTAIEPWHVLGEETTTQGTSRFVDSSVERLQVKVTGMTGPRHIVVCNGRRVPLRATGTHGEYAAGVRFRAWAPPSALHPSIGIQAPLVFDLVDTWNGRSIGGCTYHVDHPGGRHYETLPVNSYEAEGRRVSRFWTYGHTPGPLNPPEECPQPEYPYTLDLRRQPRP